MSNSWVTVFWLAALVENDFFVVEEQSGEKRIKLYLRETPLYRNQPNTILVSLVFAKRPSASTRKSCAIL